MMSKGTMLQNILILYYVTLHYTAYTALYDMALSHIELRYIILH